MAAIGIERDTCTGRGFDVNGFLGRLKAWVVKSQVNHGPGWYIVDDQSGISPNPYIVVSTHSGAYSNASLAKYIQFLLPTSTAGEIHVTYFLSWHPSVHAGVEWARWTLSTLDSAGFAYDFRGGPEFLGIIARIGSSGQFAALDTIDGDDDLVEPETHAAVLASSAYLESGDTGNQLSGYHNLFAPISVLDANRKLYFNLRNTSGSTYIIDVFNNVGRTTLVGQSATFLNTALGAKNITGVGPGLGLLSGNVTLDATATAVTTIDCRFYRMTVGSGEGANLTPGKTYYMFDLSTPGSTGKFRYVTLTAVSGDDIDLYPGPIDFPAGTIIRPFPHRWAAFGNNMRGASNPGGLRQHYPYGSNAGGELPVGWGVAGPLSDKNFDGRVARLNPDDYGNYTMSEISLTENSFSNLVSGGNRSYGYLKNILAGSNTGVALFQDNRTTPDGKSWQYINTDGTYGFYMINSEASS